MNITDYSEFEIIVMGRIQGVIEKSLRDGKTMSQVAEAVYLAWPEIAKWPWNADSSVKIPDRY